MTTFTSEGGLRSIKAKAERSLPRNTEELRARITLMGTAWIMLSLSQGNSTVLADLTPKTWEDYLKFLLGRKVLMLGYNGPASGAHVATPPSWSLLLSYEHELRRSALEEVREEGIPFGAARVIKVPARQRTPQETACTV